MSGHDDPHVMASTVEIIGMEDPESHLDRSTKQESSNKPSTSQTQSSSSATIPERFPEKEEDDSDKLPPVRTPRAVDDILSEQPPWVRQPDTAPSFASSEASAFDSGAAPPLVDSNAPLPMDNFESVPVNDVSGSTHDPAATPTPKEETPRPMPRLANQLSEDSPVTGLAKFYKTGKQREAEMGHKISRTSTVTSIMQDDGGPKAKEIKKSERHKKSCRDSRLDSNSSFASSRSGTLSQASGGTSVMTEDILAGARQEDGSLDLSRLGEILSTQKSNFRKRLEKERAKRKVLEELILSTSMKSQEQDSRKGSVDSLGSSIVASQESSSQDTSDLLLGLVRHHLKKKQDRRRTSRTSDQSERSANITPKNTPTPTIERPDPRSFKEAADAHVTDIEQSKARGVPDKENYYKSTSLFTLPPDLPGALYDGSPHLDSSSAPIHHQHLSGIPAPPPRTFPPKSWFKPGSESNGIRESELANQRREERVGGANQRRGDTGSANQRRYGASGSVNGRHRREERRRWKEPDPPEDGLSTQELAPSTPWWWVSTGGRPNFNMPKPISSVFMEKKSDFITRSQERQRRIAAASFLRKELRREERGLAEDVVLGRKTLGQAQQIMAARQDLASPAAFSRKEMTEFTKKKFYQLPEYKERQRQLQNQFDAATNRVAARMYQQKIQYRVLMKGTTANKFF